MSGSTRLAVALAVLATGRLAAQSPLEQFSYDSLRPSGLGVEVGVLGSNRLAGALQGALRFDYGFIAPKVRLLFGASFFRARFSRTETNRFQQRLESLCQSPCTIDVGTITWSDLTGDLDLQYTMPQGTGVTAYMGLGAGLHLRHGSGSAINGTFVQDALDGVTAGLNGTLGADWAVMPGVRLTLGARGVLASGLSTLSVAGGVMFRFPGGQR